MMIEISYRKQFKKNENEAISLKYGKKYYYQSWKSDIQENPMESTKKLSELINRFIRLQDTRLIHKNLLYFYILATILNWI